MVDILLDRSELGTMRTDLFSLIEEFKNAAATNDVLQEAVGRPDDRKELQRKARDFESAWDGSRGALIKSLEAVHDRVDSILESWAEWEDDAVKNLEAEG